MITNTMPWKTELMPSQKGTGSSLNYWCEIFQCIKKFSSSLNKEMHFSTTKYGCLTIKPGPQKKPELNKPWRVTTKMAAVFQVRFDIWMNTWMI